MIGPVQRVQRPAPADRAFGALVRALRPYLGDHHILSGDSRDWASATFIGARHRLGIALRGGDAPRRADWLRTMLSEADLPIAGGFVADIALVVRMEADRAIVAIEALTIEE